MLPIKLLILMFLSFPLVSEGAIKIRTKLEGCSRSIETTPFEYTGEESFEQLWKTQIAKSKFNPSQQEMPKSMWMVQKIRNSIGRVIEKRPLTKEDLHKLVRNTNRGTIDISYTYSNRPFRVTDSLSGEVMRSKAGSGLEFDRLFARLDPIQDLKNSIKSHGQRDGVDLSKYEFDLEVHDKKGRIMLIQSSYDNGDLYRLTNELKKVDSTGPLKITYKMKYRVKRRVDSDQREFMEAMKTKGSVKIGQVSEEMQLALGAGKPGNLSEVVLPGYVLKTSDDPLTYTTYIKTIVSQWDSNQKIEKWGKFEQVAVTTN